MTDLGKELIEGLEEVIDHAKGQKTKIKVVKRFFVHTKNYNAKLIKSLRKKYQLSQQDLADLLGVSVDTVRSWEKGYNTPSGSSSRILQAIEIKGNMVFELFDSRKAG